MSQSEARNPEGTPADPSAAGDAASRSDAAAGGDAAPRSDAVARNDAAPGGDPGARGDAAPRSDAAPRNDAAPGADPGARSDATPRSDAAPNQDAAPKAEGKPLVSIDDFAKLELRVARVLQVEPHPNADRLLRLQIDLGDERRQLVAGLAQHYTPEDLVGQEIVIIANLKPAKLRGELSQGMLLAASDEDGVAILAPLRPMAPGSRIS